MSGRSKRSMVYVATIVAVLAMVSGFAMASLISTITTGGQNGYNVTAPGTTIYGAAGFSQKTSLLNTTAAACTANGGTVAPAAGATTADVYVTGEVTCQTINADWFELISFTSGSTSNANPMDIFAITVGAHPPISVTVTYSTLTTPTTVTTNIYYELGPTGTAVAAGIGISGS